MKLIDSMVKVTLNTEKALIINTLNGLIDELENAENNIIKKWEDKDYILPESVEEENLYNALNIRGYLVENIEEEEKKRKNIITQLLKKQTFINDALESISFVITYDCNFCCPYCYESKNIDGSNKAKITENMVDKAFEIAGESIRHINLFGGEPLLLDNREIINYIISKKKHIDFSIITNGYYLEEFYDTFKNLNMRSIQVTLDGPKEMHDKRRCLTGHGKTFDKILKGVSLYLSSGFQIKIRMNIDESNYLSCIELREKLIKEFSIYKDRLSFELYPLFDMHHENANKVIRHLYEHDLQDQASKDNACGQNYSDYNKFITTSIPIMNYFISGSKYHPVISYCDTHSKMRFFDPHGDLYCCILAVGRKEARVGTYYPAYTIEKNSIFERDISKIEKCSTCKYAFLCGGGCPLKALDEKQEGHAASCNKIHYELHKVLPMILQIDREGSRCTL